MCAVKPYDIVTVKNALVKPVCCVMECTSPNVANIVHMLEWRVWFPFLSLHIWVFVMQVTDLKLLEF
jgi:hypothetical protein